MRQVSILGMSLRDYSVREAMRLLQEYINDDVCNRLDFVTHELLLSASEKPELAGYIQGADLTVFTSADILAAANMAGRAREKEIESALFLKGMLRKFSKERRGLFLVAGSEEEAEAVKEELNFINKELNFVNEELNFCGSSILAQSDTDADSVVNDINSVIPEVVILKLAAGMGEKFMADNSMKINARLLVSLGDTDLRGIGSRQGGFRDFIIRRLFKREASRYQG